MIPLQFLRPAGGLLLAGCLLAYLPASSQVQKGEPPAPKEMTTVELAEFIRGALVRIYVTDVGEGVDPATKQPVRMIYGRSSGTGFIIRKATKPVEGGKLPVSIVTNAHVIRPKAGKWKGKPTFAIEAGIENNFTLTAEVRGYDTFSDLAVLTAQFAPVRRPRPSPFADEINPEDYGIRMLRWADPAQVKVGEDVFAVGFPRGFDILEREFTITSGIVSAKNRSANEGRHDGLIQTNAAISPGNSGGPLINRRGEVVGVNTLTLTTPLEFDLDLRKLRAVLDEKSVQEALKNPKAPRFLPIQPEVLPIRQQLPLTQGIYFARSAQTARPFVEAIIEQEKVPRVDIGCEMLLFSSAIVEKYGLVGWFIDRMEKGSPAEKAGLRPGDLIESIGGMSVSNFGRLKNAEAILPIGKELDLLYKRPRKELLEAFLTEKDPGGLDLYLLLSEPPTRTKITFVQKK